MMKSKVGIMVLIFIVFVIGTLTGVGVSSYLYYRHVFSQFAAIAAVSLSERINILSQLRMGEIDSAIEKLELSFDTCILSVQIPNIPRTDYRYRVLRGAKTYRELYPTKSRAANKVTEALIDIPKIETFKCDTPLCRLVTRMSEEKSK